MTADPIDRPAPAAAPTIADSTTSDAVELAPVAPVTSELLRRRARAGCDRRHRPSVPADAATTDGAR